MRYIMAAKPSYVLKPRAFRLAACIMEAGDFSSQRRTSAAFARGISLKQQRKAAVPALKRRADLFDAAVPATAHGAVYSEQMKGRTDCLLPLTLEYSQLFYKAQSHCLLHLLRAGRGDLYYLLPRPL